MMKYLDYQINLTDNTQSVIWESVTKLEQFQKDMKKLKTYFTKEINILLDNDTIQEQYEAYKVAFTNYNKVQNMNKHVDTIFTGSVKYL